MKDQQIKFLQWRIEALEKEIPKDIIKLYFESNSTAELVATFNDEEIYIACVPALEKLAKKHKMMLSESVN